MTDTRFDYLPIRVGWITIGLEPIAHYARRKVSGGMIHTGCGRFLAHREYRYDVDSPRCSLCQVIDNAIERRREAQRQGV